MKQIFDGKQPQLLLETGSNRVVMFLNEETREVTEMPPYEGAEPIVRIEYLYDVTWMEPETKEKGDVVNAIIRTKYSESNELAIQRHYANDKVAYEKEWTEYNNWCEEAKKMYDKTS